MSTSETLDALPTNANCNHGSMAVWLSQEAGHSVLPSMFEGVEDIDSSRTESRYTVASAPSTAFMTETSGTDGRRDKESLRFRQEERLTRLSAQATSS